MSEVSSRAVSEGRWTAMDRLAFTSLVPIRAMIELTLRCNLKCPHCYNVDRDAETRTAGRSDRPGASRLPIVNTSASSKEAQILQTQEVEQCIDGLAELGTFRLYFTGGEVLLRKDLVALVQYAHRRRMFVGIKTNGALLDAAKIAALAAAGLNRVDVSIYGPSAEVHDRFVGAHRAFDKSWFGIEQALAVGLEVRVSYSLRKDTVDGVEGMQQKALALGAEFGIDANIHARHDGDTSPMDWRIDEKDWQRLYEGPLRSMRPSLHATDAQQVSSVQCGCARNSIGIGADGTVYPCLGAPIPAGHLRSQSLAAIWKHSPVFADIRGLSLSDFKSCADCELRHGCQRSSGATYLATGEYTGADPWTCAQAKAIIDAA